MRAGYLKWLPSSMHDDVRGAPRQACPCCHCIMTFRSLFRSGQLAQVPCHGLCILSGVHVFGSSETCPQAGVGEIHSAPASFCSHDGGRCGDQAPKKRRSSLEVHVRMVLPLRASCLHRDHRIMSDHWMRACVTVKLNEPRV